MVVQHNLTAMNSNRMLGLTVKQQAKSTEKLSSGYKINRAADDAAGLSISEKMRKQIRGLTQASLNAQDGISAVQTAEGAMHEIQDMLQRMNELAVKASNGTMSADDRGYIQDEIDQLITEIDRVSETTKFNETYLLKGDAKAPTGIDFAYKETEALKQDLYYIAEGKVQTVKKGTLFSALDTSLNYYSSNVGPQAGQQIDGAKSGEYVAQSKVFTGDNLNLYTLNTADNKYYQVVKGTVYDGTGTTYYSSAAGNVGGVESKMAIDAQAADKAADRFLVLSGKEVYDTAGNKVAAGTDIGAAGTDISKYYANVGVIALGPAANAITGAGLDNYKMSAKVQFVDKDGNEIAQNGLYRYLNEEGKLLPNSGLFVKTGEGIVDRRTAKQVDVDAMVDKSDFYDVGKLSLKLHVGADSTDNNQITLDLDSISARVLGIDDISVDGSDDNNALNAIETVKEAIQKVSTQRSALGAVQNRLEHTINNLDNVVENTTAAESQIRDTDMATEMVRFSNNNILAQAGQAMLAQANQSNQGILSILG